jgi:hypothetical protein
MGAGASIRHHLVALALASHFLIPTSIPAPGLFARSRPWRQVLDALSDDGEYAVCLYERANPIDVVSAIDSLSR